jgi:tRNA (mo5U34)-methyltransferase
MSHTSQLERDVARYRWYHTLDLGQGIVTEGIFDHRPVVRRYLLPTDLSGMRCLDVGTMDGFWAFEMERRGAAEVVAADVAYVDDLDWPPRWRGRVEPTLDRTKADRFALAHRALDSQVQRIERSVYELAGDLGKFDLIFCGDLLIHLKDPVTAIQRMRSICRGSTILCNPVKRFRFGRGRPLAEFDGIDEFQWWLLSEAAIKRIMLAVGFDQIEVGRRFALPPRGGGPWKGLRGVLRGYVS